MKEILDIYSDYLISSFGQTTATGLSALVDGEISHDQVTRMLSKKKLTAKDWWRIVKPLVRQIETEAGVLIFDDSISEKPYSDENDIICWHYDHAKGRNIKGINFITALYHNQGVSLPVTFELVEKTDYYVDKKSGKEKRRSPTTKNEHFRDMLKQCCQTNKLKFKYVLNDIWFSSSENMRLIKSDLKKEFIMAMKGNRKVALSQDAKDKGQYQKISELQIPEGTTVQVYVEQVSFPLLLVRQDFTNEDGSTGVRYLVSSDLTLKADEMITIFQKRWKVEEYHRSLKQNASLMKSPTRTVKTQTNHFIASLWAFTKIETLSKQMKKNHYQLKTKLYISAIKQAYQMLRQLEPITLAVNPIA